MLEKQDETKTNSYLHAQVSAGIVCFLDAILDKKYTGLRDVHNAKAQETS